MTLPPIYVIGYFLSQSFTTLYGVAKAFEGIPLIHDNLIKIDIGPIHAEDLIVVISSSFLIIQSVLAKGSSHKDHRLMKMLEKQLAVPYLAFLAIEKYNSEGTPIYITLPDEYIEIASNYLKYVTHNQKNIPDVDININSNFIFISGDFPEDVLKKSLHKIIALLVLIDAACILLFTPTVIKHATSFFKAQSSTAITAIHIAAWYGSISNFWIYYIFRLPKAILGWLLLSHSEFRQTKPLSKSIVISVLSALANVLFPWLIQPGSFSYFYLVPSILYLVTQFLSTYFNFINEGIAQSTKTWHCSPLVIFNLVTCAIQAIIYDFSFTALTIKLDDLIGHTNATLSDTTVIEILSATAILAIIMTIKTWLEGLYMEIRWPQPKNWVTALGEGCSNAKQCLLSQFGRPSGAPRFPPLLGARP